MATSVFISYNHQQQGEWVWDRLVPCLRAGGVRVVIDRERFRAGRQLDSEIEAAQKAARFQLLVLSPNYLTNAYCQQEMARAIALDPTFEKGLVLPVVRQDGALPAAITEPDLLRIDLQDDGDAAQWQRLLTDLGIDLGIDAPRWLRARDRVRRFLERNQSVNLVVPQNHVKWKPLIAHLEETAFPGLVTIDLENPATSSRRALVQEILRSCGVTTPVPPPPEDLVALRRVPASRGGIKLAMIHFDLAAYRPTYDVDLFAALRYLVTEARKLVLLIHSRAPFETLIPADHPLSPLSSTALQTVELRSGS